MPAVLTLLRIKNLALVEELEWQMGSGFIAITGETGAGKSIIIGALQLCWANARTNRSFAPELIFAPWRQFLAEMSCKN